MSDDKDIPWDKMSKGTVNFVAGLKGIGSVLVMLAASGISVYALREASASQKSAAASHIEVVKENAAIRTELKLEINSRQVLEKELILVRSEMVKIISDKDAQIEKLTARILHLETRESELTERIAALKLQDGKPNSFE